jgi:hypothetical protein
MIHVVRTFACIAFDRAFDAPLDWDILDSNDDGNYTHLFNEVQVLSSRQMNGHWESWYEHGDEDIHHDS